MLTWGSEQNVAKSALVVGLDSNDRDVKLGLWTKYSIEVVFFRARVHPLNDIITSRKYVSGEQFGTIQCI